jgi:hypothetical protein
MTERHRLSEAEGAAALGICESLLLALTDLNILSEEAVRDLLTDVATANLDAIDAPDLVVKHAAVAGIIQRILDGKNGLRNPV